MKVKLLGMNPSQIGQIVLAEGLPKYTAGQIVQWLYKKKVGDVSLMTNLSRLARERLSEKYEIGVTPYSALAESADGTKKYLFPVRDAYLARYEAEGWKRTGAIPEDEGTTAVEAVMIPDGERATLCVSSQSGCRMGCRFCMTGRQGFHGNLSVAEILSQFYSVDESDMLTNAVFMGMGNHLTTMTMSWLR